MRPHRRLHGEQGASLVLALAFLTLFSVVAVSTLTLTGVSFRNTEVTRSKAQKLYAADGGIENAIQKLVNEEWCVSQADVPSEFTLPTPINGQTVTVTCQTTAGGRTDISGNPLLNNYEAVVGSGGVTLTGNGCGQSVFHGSVYSGGPVTPGAVPWYCGWGAIPARTIAIDGNLDVAGACPSSSSVTATSCRPNQPVPNIAIPKVKVPTATAPAPVNLQPFVGINCTILYPGRYSTLPPFDATRNYYMASGTYYFPGSGDLTLQGQIFGGAPGADVKRVTGASSCANYAGYADDNLADAVEKVLIAGTYAYDAPKAGTGVTIVRGGTGSTGKVKVQDPRTKVELYTRVPVAGGYDEGAAPVTFWANTSSQGTIPGSGSYSAVGANTEIFLTTDLNAEVILHGLSYLPHSYATLAEPFNTETTSPGQISFFLGGVAIKKLTVERIFDGNYPPVSLSGTGETSTIMEPRTTTVTAATAGSAGTPTTVVAVVKPDEPSGPAIQSWRKV